MALNKKGSVCGVKEGAVVLSPCIHHHSIPTCERDFKMATSHLVPSALSAAQMLEFLIEFGPGSYTPKYLLMKFHSISKLVLSSFFFGRKLFVTSSVFSSRHHTSLLKLLIF